MDAQAGANTPGWLHHPATQLEQASTDVLEKKMTNPIEVEALLREADDYLAGSQHRPTRMVRRLREALAAELAHSSEMSQEAGLGLLAKADAGLGVAWSEIGRLQQDLDEARRERAWLRDQAATAAMRGKQAEQWLAAAPHDSGCWMASGRNGYSCTCWKSRTRA